MPNRSQNLGQTPAMHPVAIVGARGYSGLELARILLKHPGADLQACFATESFRLHDLLMDPKAKNVQTAAVGELLPNAGKYSCVFLATPVEASMKLAPQLLAAGANVIDLSGAFRLQEGSADQQSETYKKWYKTAHTETELLSQAEFGLMPWVTKTSTITPHLVANPGCFATAVLMGLLPLLKNKLIDANSIVIDAKSGTTGAGRKAEEHLLHSEVDGLCLPYRVGQHQHEPEIRQFCRRFVGASIQPHFTTHLLPTRRGIVASIYGKVPTNVISLAADEKALDARVAEAYAAAYGEDPLVRFSSLNSDEGQSLMNLRRVVGTARTHIAFRVVEDRLYVFVFIDNLMKGAASQAVENFNRLLGLPSWTGLSDLEGVL